MLEIPYADLSTGFEICSAAILAIVGVGSLAITARSVVNQGRDSRQARTFEYVRRLYDLEFAAVNTRVLTFLQTGAADVFKGESPIPVELGDDEKRKAYDALGLDLINKVTLVLNFYEELSGSYRKKLLDRGVADAMLLPGAVEAWKRAEWLVVYERETACEKHGQRFADEIMVEWQQLVATRPDGLPTVTAGGRVRAFARLGVAYLIPVAAIFAVLGLVVVALATDGFRDVVASFLFAAAAVCLVCGAATLAQRLSLPPVRQTLLVGLSVLATLSIGTTVTYALRASHGSPGPSGQTGESGPRGPDGAEGPEGEPGSPGAEGKTGPRGKRGRRGEPGPRGARGSTAYVGS